MTAATDIPCPFCGETIKSTAKKCKHCNEFLEVGLTNEAILEQSKAAPAAAPVPAAGAPAVPVTVTTTVKVEAAPAAPAPAPSAPVVEAPAATPAPATAEAAPAQASAPAAPAAPAPDAAAAPAATPEAAAQENMLASLYQQIDSLPDSDEKEKLLKNLKVLEDKKDDDDESGVEEIVKNVAELVPDVAEIAINTLINPASGVTTLVQKVAMRMAKKDD